jgi:FtsH-binding integral membrane protein
MLDQILDRKVDTNSKPMTKEFFANVYSYMFAGLAITGVIAWFMGSDVDNVRFMYTEQGTMAPIAYIVMFAPLAVVMAIQFGYNKFSMPVLLLLFVVFAVLLGVSLSSIFLVYTTSSIASTFLITAGTFGAMAVLGYTTKTDLSKFGSLMYMLFIGIFIASLVNMFMRSDSLSWMISFIGIFVFTGLTAWEMQRLKYIASDPSLDGNSRSKLALIGGLQLYMLFINLFLSLLRLLGDRG